MEKKKVNFEIAWAYMPLDKKRLKQYAKKAQETSLFIMYG